MAAADPYLPKSPKMAALRIFARGSLATILDPSRSSSRVAWTRVAPLVLQIQQRWSSFKSSPKYKYGNPKLYTDYEITNDPNEWKYVERLLRYKIIPKPPTGDVKLPSGFKPACASPHDHPYFVERTKNYMQPVYLNRTHRGMKRVTIINKIQGDIWKLKSDLAEYLKEVTGKNIPAHLHEFAGTIKFKGDYVSRIKEWMDTKGF